MRIPLQEEGALDLISNNLSNFSKNCTPAYQYYAHTNSGSFPENIAAKLITA